MNKSTQKPSEQLLALIEELNLPICPEDTLSRLSGMTEEEIETLLPSFEYVKAYHTSLSKEARIADPNGYEEANNSFQKELHELRKNYLKKAEDAQGVYDQKADEIDSQSAEKISTLLTEDKDETKEMEESFAQLNERIRNAATLASA